MKVLLLMTLATSAWCTPIHSGSPIKQEDAVTGKVRVVTYVADEHGFKAQIKNEDGSILEKDPSAITIQSAKLVEVAPVRYSVKHSPVVHYYAGWPFPSRHSFGFKKPKPEAASKPASQVVPESPVTYFSEDIPFFNEGQQQQFSQEQFSQQSQPQQQSAQFFSSGFPFSAQQIGAQSFYSQQTQPQKEQQQQFQFYSGDFPIKAESGDTGDTKGIQVSPAINFYSGSWPKPEEGKEDIEDSEDEQAHTIVRKIPYYTEQLGQQKIAEKNDKPGDNLGPAASHISSGSIPITQQLKSTASVVNTHHIIQKIPSILHHQAKTSIKEDKPHQIVQKIPSYTLGSYHEGVKSSDKHVHAIPVVDFTGSFSGQKSGDKIAVHQIVHKIPTFPVSPLQHGLKEQTKYIQTVPVGSYTGGWPVFSQIQPATKSSHAYAGVPYTSDWPVVSQNQGQFLVSQQGKQIFGSGIIPVVAYSGNWPGAQGNTDTSTWPIVTANKEQLDFKAVIAQAPFYSGAVQHSVKDGVSPVTSEWTKLGFQSQGSQKPESKVDSGPVSYTPAFQWSAAGSMPTDFKAPPQVPGYAAIPLWW